MITRVKIVKSHIEKLLDKVNPNWEEQTLYKWQYGGDNHSPDFATENLYNLEEFKKIQSPPYIFYTKGDGFILEEENDPFTDVLTNIEPPTKDKGTYNPKEKIREVDINDLFEI